MAAGVNRYMWTFQRASALGLAIGASLGLLAHLAGFDQMSSGHALYAAAYDAVESAVELIGTWN